MNKYFILLEWSYQQALTKNIFMGKVSGVYRSNCVEDAVVFAKKQVPKEAQSIVLLNCSLIEEVIELTKVIN